MCCPTHCATYCAPCQSLLRAPFGWIVISTLRRAARRSGRARRGLEGREGALPLFNHKPTYRGPSPIRKRTPLGPYRRPVPRGVLGGLAVSYERDTPVHRRLTCLFGNKIPISTRWSTTLHQKSTCITQFTLGPRVMQIWSCYSRNFDPTKASSSTMWLPTCVTRPGQTHNASIPSPTPYAISPKPSGLKAQPSARSHKPRALRPKPTTPCALRPAPCALSPKPEALNPQP